MKKILLIDDSHIILDKMKKFLLGADYEVETATDGGQGLKRIEEQEFDLVILDIEMPGMNGFEMCRRLRSLEGRALLPQVVFFSSHEEPSRKTEGLKLGVSDFIVKSLAWELPDEFLARLEAHLKITALLKEKVELEKLRILQATMVSVNHEIANPLQNIIFAVDRIAGLEKEHPGEKKYFDAVVDNIERIGTILQKLTTAVQAATVEYAEGVEMLDLEEMTKCRKKS